MTSKAEKRSDMNHTEEKLGTESLGSLMLSMGIPTLVAQMINLLYNIVDRVYIGQGVGREALTGLGLALPAITIVSAFSALAGAGGAPLAAIALGQGDREKAERITGNVFTLLCVFSAIIMLVFYAAQKPFLYLVGASDATYPYASEYLSIYLIGTICVQIVLGLNPFITAQGQSKTAMGSVLIGAALNIVLDPIFIFVFHMGVKGAALATILSQLAGAIWVLRFMTSKKTSLRLKCACLRPDFHQIGAILSLGMAPFIMQSTESLISIVMSSGLQRYGGDLYVGSLTILQSIMQLTSAPINGFTTVDIGRERGNNSYNMVQGMEAPFATQYMQLFDTLWNDQNKMQDVTDIVIENITNAYNENSPEFIYFMTLYHVFSEFLEDISEDVLPNEATGFKQNKIWNLLYDFQKDAVLAIINKLEKYNGHPGR